MKYRYSSVTLLSFLAALSFAGLAVNDALIFSQTEGIVFLCSAMTIYYCGVKS